MTDPSPFLSTITASSAAMVAIVGGLLVARFVTLESEQEGAQRVLRDAEARLETVRDRAKEAAKRWYDLRVEDYFDRDLLRTIGKGNSDIGSLRKIGGWTSLSDGDLQREVTLAAGEFAVARATLSNLDLKGVRRSAKDWEDFRDTASGLPQIRWDRVWEICYIDLLTPPASESPIYGYGMNLSAVAVSSRPEYVVLDAQRRDALKAGADRTQQQLEDVEGEVARLRRARDSIVRPKGLVGGLVVLAIFTCVGVIYPIWLMSGGPKDLTHSMGLTVFWWFLGGLLLLLLYMAWLAVRLSGLRRRGSRKERSSAN